jgi:hypothetical protein
MRDETHLSRENLQKSGNNQIPAHKNEEAAPHGVTSSAHFKK